MARTSLVRNPCSFAEIKNLIKYISFSPGTTPRQHKQLEIIKVLPLIIDKAQIQQTLQLQLKHCRPRHPLAGLSSAYNPQHEHFFYIYSFFQI